MGIQINGNTNNINAGIGSLSIEDINELDIVGVATAANFKTGVSNLHNVGLTLSGGQIDVGSNIKIGTAGVVTATTFVGNLTGTASTATTIDTTATSTNANMYMTFVDTQTTGRTLRTDAGVTYNPNSNALTAGSFVGDGSNLTGISAITINNNSNGRVITATGNANELDGQPNLSFSNSGGDPKLTISGSGHAQLTLTNTSGADHTGVNFGDSADINAGMIQYSNSNNAMQFHTNGSEALRITSGGDISINSLTGLSSPYTSFTHLSISNKLILNSNNASGGYTGFQNNAYVNSSGNWVRVENDHASSIGMDDGNFYFRNVGAGTGNISWSMPLQINANGTSTFGSTINVNGYVNSQGSSGRGAILGGLLVGHNTLYNTIQNLQANTPVHLQYSNTGNIKCNEGGGKMQTRDIFPESNNSYSLGTDAKRWANIHTNDLNLSNEGSTNDVDGTWGQYTIQEGEHDLFLINKRNGKRYKFNLTEVD